MSSRAGAEPTRPITESAYGIPVGTPQHFGWLHGIVKTVLVLNLLDAIFTLAWVRAGLATEANDLIDELVNEHAIAFVLVKLTLVGLGSWLLWNRRDRPIAVIAIFAAFLAYYWVVVIHIQYASNLLGQLLRGA